MNAKIAMIAALPREIAGLVRGVEADTSLVKEGVWLYRVEGAWWWLRGWERRGRRWRWRLRWRRVRWGCWCRRGWLEGVRRGWRLGR